MADGKPNKPASAPKPDAQSERPIKPPKPDLGDYDSFVIQKTFPEPMSLLTVHPPVATLANDCIFALDANVLLLPFKVGAESLADIEKVFRQQVAKDNLYVPAQALREYARHRSKRVADVYDHVKHLLKLVNDFPVALNTPMFEATDEYKAAAKAVEGLKDPFKAYRTALDALLRRVEKWNANDPVSVLYAELLTTKVVHHEMSDAKLKADCEYRNRHDLPPGFKDGSKLDGGIGDLIIWHTLLKLGQEKQRNLIFVSNDKKSDWRVRGKDESLFPRYELVEEFNRVSGKHFALMDFSEFLASRGATPTTVKEISKIKEVGAAWERDHLAQTTLFRLRQDESHYFKARSIWPEHLREMATEVSNVLRIKFQSDSAVMEMPDIDLIARLRASLIEFIGSAGLLSVHKDVTGRLMSGLGSLMEIVLMQLDNGDNEYERLLRNNIRDNLGLFREFLSM